MLMNDKIVIDHFIELYKFRKNERNNGALYFTTSSHFHMRKSLYSFARSGQTSDSHYKHKFCVAPAIEHN